MSPDASSPQDPKQQPESQPTPRKKKPAWLVALVVVLFLLFAPPIINLFMAGPKDTALAKMAKGDPKFEKAAEILERKCADCHSGLTGVPWYGRMPVAQTMIQKDIDAGRRYFDFIEDVAPGEGQPANEVALAKIEYALDNNLMPPTKYAMMHWNRTLGGDDVAALQDWIKTTREGHYSVATVSEENKDDVLQPLPTEFAFDVAKAALGDDLYHDKRLSSDNTLSCASCHGLDTGGCDREPVSTGVNDAKGPINSPTVYNARYFVKQFWDGRAEDLKDQAAGPVNNPIEMGSNWEQVLGKLTQDEALVARFDAIYDDGVTGDNITDAIAEFEKSLVTPHNRFDAYLRGDKDALKAEEFEGLALFRENACANCHVGKAMGGQSFEFMGRRADYFADRGNLTDVDKGRMGVTGSERDRHCFKVPTLRNVELTYPYFHDAQAKTLEDAVVSMAHYQGYRDFSDAEAAKVVAFLKTLTADFKDGRLY